MLHRHARPTINLATTVALTLTLMTVSGPLGVGGVDAAAQEASLRAERVVDFRMDKPTDLMAQVGPVKVESVEFSNLGHGSGRGGFAGKLKPPGGSASEASATIRAHFLAQNPQSDEWEVTFVLEFLDKGGKLVEKVTKKSSWEGEAKPYNLDHELLEYVVPMIARVRIKMEARLD